MKLRNLPNPLLMVALTIFALLLQQHVGKASQQLPQNMSSASGTTEKVTRAFDGSELDFSSYAPAISVDGRYVAFYSQATNLVPGDNNNFCELDYVDNDYDDSCPDLFLFDRQTEQSSLITVSSSGEQANQEASPDLAMSDDGRYIAFSHIANNLVAGDTSFELDSDVFLRDTTTAETKRISKGHDGSEVDGSSYSVSMSPDGRYIAFVSKATNIVPDDEDGYDDIFVFDQISQTLTLVSVADDGSQSDGDSSTPSISSDGRYVAFYSDATNLVASGASGFGDIYIHDRDTDNNGVFDEAGNIENTLVSKGMGGAVANGGSYSPAISDDGKHVTFVSQATNLVSNDTQNTCTINGYPGGNYNCPDAFVYSRQTGNITLVSADSSGVPGNGASRFPAISSDGRYVTFESLASNLVSDDTNDYCSGDTPNCQDIFARDLQMSQTTRVSVSTFGVEAIGTSQDPAISADGRYIAFSSHARNLTLPNDSTSSADIFVHDREGVVYHAYFPLVARP